MPCPNALHAHSNQPRTVRCGAANPDRPRLNLKRGIRILQALARKLAYPEISDASFHLTLSGPLLAVLAHGPRRFCARLILSITGQSPRKHPRKGSKGTFHGTLDCVSHCKGRRPHHLLQRSRGERRANPSPPPRTPVFIANV